jgi:hypothetical protein
MQSKIAPGSTSTLPSMVTTTLATVTFTVDHRPLNANSNGNCSTDCTEEPVQLEPTAVLTPISIGPPAPDGMLTHRRCADPHVSYISAAPSAQDRIRYGLSVSPDKFDARAKRCAITVSPRSVPRELVVSGSRRAAARQADRSLFDDGYVGANFATRFRFCRNTT